MGYFTSGEKGLNDKIDLYQRKALGELGTGNISRIFSGLQQNFSPMLAQMAQGAQVGANMDTQSMQANLARQGLGGTGLGVALGGGLRSGANFQTNQLRAKLLADLFGQAQGLAGARANTFMQAGSQFQAEPGGFQQTMGAVTGMAGAAGDFITPFALLQDKEAEG